MKKRFFSLFLITTMIVVLFSGCSKDGVLQLPSLKAKLNGNEWVSTFRLTTHANVSGTDMIMITATNMNAASGFSDGEYLMIIVRGMTQGKTYDLKTAIAGGKFETSITYYDKGGSAGTNSAVYQANSGTITLTKVDMASKRISGTFQYSLVNVANPGDVKTFTLGTFDNLFYVDGTIPGAK